VQVDDTLGDILTRKTYVCVVAALLLCAWAGIYVYFSYQVAAVVFTVEMASSSPGLSRLFFDTGSGFRKADSQDFFHFSRSLYRFKRLTFDLPLHREIKEFRFAPLTTQGKFIVRNVVIKSSDSVLMRIPPIDVVAFDQIDRRVQNGSEVFFSTIPNATLPLLTLRLRQPLQPTHKFSRVVRSPSFWIVIIAVSFVGFMAVLLRDRRISAIGLASRQLRRADEFFERIAARLSIPEALSLDSSAIWFSAVCVTLFLIAVGFNLNGSSAGILPSSYGHGGDANIWIGSLRGVRSDEWAYQTPDILNQVLRADRFEALNSQLGGHSVALTGNIPVRHISELFRPQYWPFFFLPTDYAFAFYWQCKALILVLGSFFWLLLLTRSSFWSITGSLWYFFSPLTQWAYSWPSALPETTGFLLLSIVLACCLTVEKRNRTLLLLSVGLIICATEFALCSYLPHMIPLFWLGVFSFVSWCVARRSAIFQRQHAGARLLAFSLVALAIGAIGLLVFADLRVAIAGIANTVYPGHRTTPSGATRWFVLLSSFLAWTQTESRIPAALGNISEGSSCLWLAPATLLLFGRLTLLSFQKWALAALWLLFIILLIWLVVPIPAALGEMLGLDRSGGPRVFPVLGLANIAITMLCGASISDNRPIRSKSRTISLAVLGFAGVLFLLMAVNRHVDDFFSRIEVIGATLIVTLLVYLFLSRRKWAFATLLILPQVIVFGRANPIERGLSVYLDSDLRRFIQQHPALLTEKWLMFSDSVVSSGFLASTGAQVYTGTHYLPDIDHFPLFAASGLDVNILNRDGYLNAHLRSPGEPMKVTLPETIIVRWDVRPGDPILKELGIKYVASDVLPDEEALAWLRPLAENPVDGFWLYELR